VETAHLVGAALMEHAPVTNHYQCSDGRWLLVTVIPADMRMIFYTPAAVYLSDDQAAVLDADGDLANGMTPFATPEGSTHAEVLAALGYTEVIPFVTAAPRDSLST
jgi:hypothetical protein